ncbi:Protein of unknown function (DUF3071) [Isoptericola jiangsuensis]|uniref:DUF3071 domain-containing protein n=1 Tax=Isoptericola jiangsuensis TaxID=548579 RepID=A0A2A9EYW2_9MICO|nr:septation protein SepH [Isoptericola jiangsuensis]PFG43430.1 Protein of unknown function (DUF3071) [Isoptericola jiangsuensis]
MAELELVTLHEDAERLVLRGPGGVEHTLAITEALRAAVRRDRPRTEALRAQSEATLRPREVQARLRAGASAEELAAESGLPLEHVQRYEWPVVAERDHVVAQVRSHRVDPESATTLGELADRRLVARGVERDGATWSARREGSAPWQVEVRFVAGDRERTATWSFDPRGRAVQSVDDEARWLGQPDDPLSPEILGVPAGRPAARRPVPADDSTARLLDDLADRRGQRPSRNRPGRPDPEAPGDRDAEGPDDADPAPARIVDLGARRDAGRSGPPEPVPVGADAASGHEPGPVPRDAADPPADHDDSSGRQGPDVATQGVLDDDLGADAPPARPRPTIDAARTVVGEVPAPPSPPSADAKPSAARRGGRKGRPQVPSWDEIVFGGARPSSP